LEKAAVKQFILIRGTHDTTGLIFLRIVSFGLVQTEQTVELLQVVHPD
jgi:hypothetical protein